MAKEWNVEITETLQRQIKVKAETADEAWKIVHDMYSGCEVVLDAEDFIDAEICVLEDIPEPYEPVLNNEDIDKVQLYVQGSKYAFR